MLKISHLRCEYLKNPIGIDAENPRFSWKLLSDRENVVQESFRIIAASDLSLKDVIWDSKEVPSAESLRVLYGGPVLKSMQRVYWKVTVTAGGETAESETAYFEMGLLSKSEWKANWIEPAAGPGDIEKAKPVVYMRRTFRISKPILRARIFQTAHGLYEFWLNGEKGTEDIFKPGFTSYYYRLQYQEYDISSLLQMGENTWAVSLGDGWWRGTTGGMYRNNFGYKAQYLGQIILEYEDGTEEIIISDENFRTSEGPVLMNDMKFGEVYDASRELTGWKKNDFDDTSWSPAVLSVDLAEKEDRENAIRAFGAEAEGKKETEGVREADKLSYDALIPSRSLPVREKETFKPELFTDAAGNMVLDFHQNLVGYVRMKLHDLKKGQQISLIHSEDIKDGVFNLGNVCTGISDNTHYQQTDYIARGDETGIYTPSFSVFGFRYVQVTGWPEATAEDFTAVAVYTDLEETGDFKCSNPLINQLVSNSRWSQKGNFLDVPTDCPTRERSAWTGDAQVYSKTASEFMNVYPFFEKWMQEVSAEQLPDGTVFNSAPVTTSMHFAEEVGRLIREDKCGFIVPGVAGPKGHAGMFDGSAGWGDVAEILPYNMYLCYGDPRILKNQYPTAKRWIDFMIRTARNENTARLDMPEYNTWENGVRDADFLFDTHFHFGEWLEPGSEEDQDPTDQDLNEQGKRTDAIVATAYLYHGCRILAETAGILAAEAKQAADDKNAADARDYLRDQLFYEQYAKEVKRVYNKYFIKEDGTVQPGHQASYVRVLAFDLADDKKTEKVAARLAEEVRKAGMKLNTGFLSTPFLLFQLVRYGYKKEAFTVLEQTEAPSWLHAVTLGATTILESWNGMDEHMASYNHYSYGAVCDFLFGKVGGIEPVMKYPGYKHFELSPMAGGSLTWAETRFDCPYGIIRSDWKLEDGLMKMHFEIPVNTTATVNLPDGRKFDLGSGSYDYSCTAPEV